MCVKLCHQVASWSTVFAWIKFFWLFVEYLTYGSGESKTRVRVDVNLSNGTLRSFAQLLLWDTNSIRQFSAIFVDNLHILLWYRRRTVKYDWESRKLLHNFVQYVESQWRWYQQACLRVTCTLLWLKLVCTV